MHVSGQRNFTAPRVVAILLALPVHAQSRVIGRATFFCDSGWNDADVVQFDAGNAHTVAWLADGSIVA